MIIVTNTRYQDKKLHGEHHWDEREDRAYRMWAKERHRPYVEFEKLRDRDRQSYWGWKNNHSDALLKLDIRL